MAKNGQSAIIACVRRMLDFGALWRRVENYASARDPLVAASNKLALILASNQPFYPVYVIWVTSKTDALLALTLLSTPFFLASPWMTQRLPRIGRLWFPTVGAINTFFCAFIFGERSGVEFFLAPCVIIAALSCRAAQAHALAIYISALAGAFFLLHGRFYQPLYTAGSAPSEALLKLNAYCAATLSVIAVWIFLRARRDTPRVIRRSVSQKNSRPRRRPW